MAVYPEEGTFFSDNPLLTLEGDWVKPEQARAGKVFAAFLAKAITPDVAGAQGFRPADPDVAPAGLVTAANGVDPKQPARVLRLPEPKVLAKIKATWRADRKPANVMMVFDNSGSMGEENKLEQAKEGLKAFFRQAAPQDRIGLIKFSQDIVPLAGPIAPMSANRAKLLAATDTILPEDDTRVRDATLDAINAVTEHLDRDAINAVVLLTDGEDTSSNHSAYDVLQRARAPALQGVRADPRLHDRLRLRPQREGARSSTRRPAAARATRAAPTTSARSTGPSARSSDALAETSAESWPSTPSTKPVNVLAPAAVLVAGLLLGAPWLVAGRVRLLARPRRGDVLRRARGAGGGRAGARGGAQGAAGGRAREPLRARDRRAAARGERGPGVDPPRRRRRRHAARSTRSSSHCRATPSAPSGSATSSREDSPAQVAERIASEPSQAVRAALEAKHSALERLQRRLTRLLEEMDNVVTTLQTVQAELLVADGLGQAELAGQVSALRETVQAVSAGLEEAFERAELGLAAPGSRPPTSRRWRPAPRGRAARRGGSCR